jgi:hypothetical protein
MTTLIAVRLEEIRGGLQTDNRMLLFRKRGAIGHATHYILVMKWQKLKFDQKREIRKEFEQVVA